MVGKIEIVWREEMVRKTKLYNARKMKTLHSGCSKDLARLLVVFWLCRCHVVCCHPQKVVWPGSCQLLTWSLTFPASIAFMLMLYSIQQQLLSNQSSNLTVTQVRAASPSTTFHGTSHRNVSSTGILINRVNHLLYVKFVQINMSADE